MIKKHIDRYILAMSKNEHIFRESTHGIICFVSAIMTDENKDVINLVNFAIDYLY